MNTTIVFRCDAGPDIGIGHVMRCLTLASSLKDIGFHINFICYPVPEHIHSLIIEEGFDIYLLSDNSNELYQVNNILKSINAGAIIIDHYGIDESYEKELYSYDKLIVIDDLADRRHHCDCLIDYSLDRKKSDYGNLLTKDCKLLLGANYCLIRKEFSDLRDQSYYRRGKNTKASSILISFGGTDPKKYTLSALSALDRIQANFKVSVLISSACPWLDELKKVCDFRDDITLFIDETEVATLMMRSDIALGSLGTSSWERACLGLPTIAVIAAENQNYNAKKLQEKGAIKLIKGENIESEIEKFFSNNLTFKKLKMMSENAFKLCDGKGVHRAIKGILSIGTDIKVAKKENLNFIYQLQMEPETRRFSRVSDMPTYAEHVKWYNASLKEKIRRIWIIDVFGHHSGFIRLDPNQNVEEISIKICRRMVGYGLALRAIELVKTKVLYGSIVAHVKPDNEASIGLFRKSGFKSIGADNYLWKEPEEVK